MSSDNDKDLQSQEDQDDNYFDWLLRDAQICELLHKITHFLDDILLKQDHTNFISCHLFHHSNEHE